VAVLFDTGFAAYRLLDPYIVGGVTASITDNVVSSDVTLMNRYLAGGNAPQIPRPPNGVTVTPTGPDPTLSLPTNLTAAAGAAVVVPVNIDTARPEESTGLTEAVLALRFDPLVFTVSASDVHLGTLPAAGMGWQLVTAVNGQTGEIGVDLFSATPIVTRNSGSLVTITLHVRVTAPAGGSAINLVPEVNPTGQRAFRTEAADSQGTFVLHPVATDGPMDAGVDGRVTVPPSGLDSVVLGDSGRRAFYVSQLVGPAAGEQAVPSGSEVKASSSGSEAAAVVTEQVFGDFEQLGRSAVGLELGQSAAALDPDTAKVASMSGDQAWLLQTPETPAVDWVSTDYLTYLGQKARRGRPLVGLLGEPLLDDAEADAVEQYFAREAAKRS
jgi:hypothetical protein